MRQNTGSSIPRFRPVTARDRISRNFRAYRLKKAALGYFSVITINIHASRIVKFTDYCQVRTRTSIFGLVCRIICLFVKSRAYTMNSESQGMKNGRASDMICISASGHGNEYGMKHYQISLCERRHCRRFVDICGDSNYYLYESQKRSRVWRHRFTLHIALFHHAVSA